MNDLEGLPTSGLCVEEVGVFRTQPDMRCYSENDSRTRRRILPCITTLVTKVQAVVLPRVRPFRELARPSFRPTISLFNILDFVPSVADLSITEMLSTSASHRYVTISESSVEDQHMIRTSRVTFSSHKAFTSTGPGTRVEDTVPAIPDGMKRFTRSTSDCIRKLAPERDELFIPCRLLSQYHHSPAHQYSTKLI
jgi:hypothetical protein